MSETNKLRETLAKLQAPIPKSQVKKLSGKGGKDLDYITARTLMERLDTVVGPENWRDEYRFENAMRTEWVEKRKVRTESRICICRLWIKLDGEWVYKEDGADDSDIEGEKGSVSGAFKRAGVKWGVFREGYPEVVEARREESKAAKVKEEITLKPGGETLMDPAKSQQLYEDFLTSITSGCSTKALGDIAAQIDQHPLLLASHKEALKVEGRRAYHKAKAQEEGAAA